MTRRAGAQHQNAKLSTEQVREIRASNLGPSALARVYKVSKATISLIKSGKSWRDSPAAGSLPVIEPEPVDSSDPVVPPPGVLPVEDVERGNAPAETAMAARPARTGFPVYNDALDEDGLDDNDE